VRRILLALLLTICLGAVVPAVYAVPAAFAGHPDADFFGPVGKVN
jgi:hypothetical protein